MYGVYLCTHAARTLHARCTHTAQARSLGAQRLQPKLSVCSAIHHGTWHAHCGMQHGMITRVCEEHACDARWPSALRVGTAAAWGRRLGPCRADHRRQSNHLQHRQLPSPSLPRSLARSAAPPWPWPWLAGRAPHRHRPIHPSRRRGARPAAPRRRSWRSHSGSRARSAAGPPARSIWRAAVAARTSRRSRRTPPARPQRGPTSSSLSPTGDASKSTSASTSTRAPDAPHPSIFFGIHDPGSSPTSSLSRHDVPSRVDV
eukprot:scaffold83105_cov67-Phaeocystis_antarctica.AAC.5